MEKAGFGAAYAIAALALLAACGGDGGMSGREAPTPPAPLDPTIAVLGEWNVLPGGTLGVGDTNDLLRASYDATGGHVMARAPIQPAGMGTATWKGQWFGTIEVNSNDRAVVMGLQRST